MKRICGLKHGGSTLKVSEELGPGVTVHALLPPLLTGVFTASQEERDTIVGFHDASIYLHSQPG
jgi:hypothetical protein